MSDIIKLDFRLPAFERISWASEGARRTWQPRLESLREAIERLPVHLTAAGAKRSVIARVKPFKAFGLKKLAREAGISAAIAGETPSTVSFVDTGRDEGEPAVLMLFCRDDSAASLLAALNNGQADGVEASGWPPCCAAFHRALAGDKVAVEGIEGTSSEGSLHERGWIDRAWPIAAGAGVEGWTAVVSGLRWRNNFLARRLGAWPLPHLPCSFDCGPTADETDAALEIVREREGRETADYLAEVLKWPAEYSLLHGIAELKLPVLKMSANTDATANKLTIRFLGTEYPTAGPRGVLFPYQAPDRAKFSESVAYRRGLNRVET